MTKTEQLQEHFAKWRQKTGLSLAEFNADGIVDETAYEKAKVKLCFLMKEPREGFDFKLWRDQEVTYPFTRRLSEWAAGVQNCFPEFDKVIAEPYSSFRGPALRASAMMNVKKSPGAGSASYRPFMNALGADPKQQDVSAELVRGQLRIMDPDVVVMGLSWSGLRQRLFPDVEWEPSEQGRAVGKWENRILIDHYHPSARRSHAATYDLLKQIWSRSVAPELCLKDHN